MEDGMSNILCMLNVCIIYCVCIYEYMIDYMYDRWCMVHVHMHMYVFYSYNL